MPRIDLSRAIYDPAGEPLDYPSAMPPGPVLITGDSWAQLRASDDPGRFVTEDGIELDRLLASRGSAPLSERTAQVAFGAHRNIENIAWKLASYARSTGAQMSRDLVIIPSELADADVVACNISSGGHMYSGLLMTRQDLSIRRYLIGCRCPVSLLLLDRAQTLAMHDMAGIAKPGKEPGALRVDTAIVTARIGASHACDALTYSVGLPFMALDGKPVAFSAVTTSGRTIKSLSQGEMFREVNRRLKAEAEMPGAIPIIDSVNRVRRELMKQEPSAVRRIADDTLFASVKAAIARDFVLRDEDGQVRHGLDDVLPYQGTEEAWRFAPLFAPRPA